MRSTENSDKVFKGNTQDTYLSIFKNEFDKIIEQDSLPKTTFFTVFEREDSFDFDQNSFSSEELDIKVMEYLEGKVSDYIGKTFETIKRSGIS